MPFIYGVELENVLLLMMMLVLLLLLYRFHVLQLDTTIIWCLCAMSHKTSSSLRQLKEKIENCRRQKTKDVWFMCRENTHTRSMHQHGKTENVASKEGCGKNIPDVSNPHESNRIDPNWNEIKSTHNNLRGCRHVMFSSLRCSSFSSIRLVFFVATSNPSGFDLLFSTCSHVSRLSHLHFLDFYGFLLQWHISSRLVLRHCHRCRHCCHLLRAPFFQPWIKTVRIANIERNIYKREMEATE